MNEKNVSGKNIAVIGAARSGVAAAQLLAAKRARVLVSDKTPMGGLGPEAWSLQSRGIEVEAGGHSERVYDCSLMVLSPGVPGNAPVVREAQRRGIEIVSELEVASWFCRGPIIAVTGSNGKTTTTSIVGRILYDAKKKHVVAGNIGTAFSSVVLGMDEETVAVLEVSSFQLDYCKWFRPAISVILNITPDHLDRYENSMEHYAASKSRIFMNQTRDDVLLYNRDDEWTLRSSRTAACRTIAFSVRERLAEGAYVQENQLVTALGGDRREVIALSQISIPGVHNVYNSMAAVLACELLDVGVPSIRATLKNFKGVEHRLEFVREVDGARFVNDSKATNVDAVRYALQAYAGPIVLILGGRDKGNDYSKLEDLVRSRVRAVVAVGESGATVVKAFGGMTRVERVSAGGSEIPNRTGMEQAVRTAKALAQPGDMVLLSPACASFDWFHNYEERGQVFKEIVSTL